MPYRALRSDSGRCVTLIVNTDTMPRIVNKCQQKDDSLSVRSL